jgi:hypothetical protein
MKGMIKYIVRNVCTNYPSGGKVQRQFYIRTGESNKLYECEEMFGIIEIEIDVIKLLKPVQ